MLYTDEHLINHLRRHSTLSETEALKIIEEIIAFYNETPQSFIRRRHYELQKSGMANAAIYTQIGHEIQGHRFISEPMTTRQIRRAIYG